MTATQTCNSTHRSTDICNTNSSRQRGRLQIPLDREVNIVPWLRRPIYEVYHRSVSPLFVAWRVTGDVIGQRTEKHSPLWRHLCTHRHRIIIRHYHAIASSLRACSFPPSPVSRQKTTFKWRNPTINKLSTSPDPNNRGSPFHYYFPLTTTTFF